VRDCAGNRHTLALAAGQLPGVAGSKNTCAEADQLERVRGPRVRVRTAIQPRNQRHIAESRPVREQARLLLDVPNLAAQRHGVTLCRVGSVYGDSPGIRLDHAIEAAQERGLAGAALPYQGNALSGAHGNCDRVERRDGAVLLDDALRMQSRSGVQKNASPELWAAIARWTAGVRAILWFAPNRRKRQSFFCDPWSEMETLTAPRIADLLTDARTRTLLLVGAVSEDDLRRQHDPLMGPIIWDLGHIGTFEELWLLQNLDGKVAFGEMPGLYNPFEHPRSVRGKLELPGIDEARSFLANIRRRVLDRLDRFDPNSEDPLLRDGYVYNMVLQHEYQHGETILQTLQLKQGTPYEAPRAFAFPHPNGGSWNGMVLFPGGRVEIGTNDRTTAYDNERASHEVTLNPFEIDVAPVTNGKYLEFMEEGGYTQREFWTDAGWAWLQEASISAPRYWVHDGSGWTTRIMNQVRSLDPARPVCHVCYHEAAAFARYARKRLPTEAEWEAACTWDPASGVKRAFPWGDDPVTAMVANVDQLAFDVSPIGAYPRNVSPIGCYGMIGDVWEWTATDFHPYPGYETFPYPEYSELFFGPEYKVLRGGSWATRPGVARATFRNWDYPIRRQIFSGFRCVRDV
jgi:iron(II)-dependent oxidoreductase